jgi:CRP-like cAMP-binding protein
MKNFTQTIQRITTIEDEILQQMTACLKLKSLKKGDFIVKADEVAKNFYFLSSGLVKLYFDNGDKNFIMTFFRENSFFTELNSFNSEQPSKYILLALEPTELFYISKSDISLLCKKHHSIETLFRKLNEVASARMMERISEFLEYDAKKRYSNFLQHNSDLLQRISLGDLADYIGITQVSLSRIRGQK